MNKCDPRSNVYYLGSSENKAIRRDKGLDECRRDKGLNGYRRDKGLDGYRRDKGLDGYRRDEGLDGYRRDHYLAPAKSHSMLNLSPLQIVERK